MGGALGPFIVNPPPLSAFKAGDDDDAIPGGASSFSLDQTTKTPPPHFRLSCLLAQPN